MKGKYKLTYKGDSVSFDFDNYTYQDASCVYDITDLRFLEFSTICNQPIFQDFYSLLKLEHKANNGLDCDKAELERLTSNVMEYIKENGDEQVKITY